MRAKVYDRESREIPIFTVIFNVSFTVKVKRCCQLKDADGIFQLVERCHWQHLLTSKNMPPLCKDAATVRSKLTLKITVKIGISQDSQSYTFACSQHTITQQLSLEI